MHCRALGGLAVVLGLVSSAPALAQGMLGHIYFLGEGVPEDYVKAHMWLSLSKAQGAPGAAKALNLVKSHMTPAQIAKAQELADEWWEEHND